jgi:hypothetical protein
MACSGTALLCQVWGWSSQGAGPEDGSRNQLWKRCNVLTLSRRLWTKSRSTSLHLTTKCLLKVRECVQWLCLCAGWAIAAEEREWKYRLSVYYTKPQDSGVFTCATPRGLTNSVTVHVTGKSSCQSSLDIATPDSTVTQPSLVSKALFVATEWTTRKCERHHAIPQPHIPTII